MKKRPAGSRVLATVESSYGVAGRHRRGDARLAPPIRVEYRATEHQEQAAFVQWADLNSIRHPQLLNLYAVPNAARRGPALASRLRREGLRAGVPDLCLAYPMGVWHGLYIEMKRTGEKQTEAQVRWFTRLRGAGYKCALCFTALEAIAVVREYLQLATK